MYFFLNVFDIVTSYLYIFQLLSREKALEGLCEERDDLRAKMEDRGRECVHLNQTKGRLEADLALSHQKLHTSHLEVHVSLSACLFVCVCSVRLCVRVKVFFDNATFS